MEKQILNAAQLQKFEKWKDEFGDLPYIGATGGHFGLKIIFTSLGAVIYGYSWNDKEIDLTDYDNF